MDYSLWRLPNSASISSTVGKLACKSVGSSSLDLEYEDRLAPAKFSSLAGVPETIVFRRNFFEQGDIVIPGNSCKRPLHNCPVGPCGREGAHIFQVSR